MVFTCDPYNSLLLKAITDQPAKVRAWRETKRITQRSVSLVWSVQFQRDLLPSPEERAGGPANKHSVKIFRLCLLRSVLGTRSRMALDGLIILDNTGYVACPHDLSAC